MPLRGYQRAASAAQYTEEKCDRILLDCSEAVDVPEGGRYTPSKNTSIETALEELHQVALQRQLALEVDTQ